MMRDNRCASLLAIVLDLCLARPLLAQRPSPQRVSSPAKTTATTRWRIQGRVTTLQGDALPGAAIRIHAPESSIQGATAIANGDGHYEATYEEAGGRKPPLLLEVHAAKEGFAGSMEMTELESPEKVAVVDVQLAKETGGALEQSPDELVQSIKPHLRYLPTDPAFPKSDSDAYTQAAMEFFDRGNLPSLPALQQVAKRHSECPRCHAFLGLLLLKEGGYVSATQELYRAAAGPGAGRARTREIAPFYILGVLEGWRRHYTRAAVFLLQGLEIEPGNSILLQELGRVCLLSGNSAAADKYLQAASAAGAPRYAHFLRAEALTDLRSADSARAEIQAYLGNEKRATLPDSLRIELSAMERRLDISADRVNQSYVNLPAERLSALIPSLHGMEPTSSQDDLPRILARTGESLREFMQDFPNTSSTEAVSQQWLENNGQARESLQREFQYLCVPLASDTDPAVKEYRTDAKGNEALQLGLQKKLMITQGFASQGLVFHPAYQRGFDFRFLGWQQIGKQRVNIVAFTPRPERTTMYETFRSGDSTWAVLVQGVAWIEDDSGHIERIHTALFRPIPEIALTRQTTEIQFASVSFRNGAASLWLPQDVAVEVEVGGRLLSNRHHYSDYKVFTVETKEKRRPVKTPRQDANAFQE